MDRKAQLIAWLAESPKDNFLKYALATEFVAEGNDDKAGELFQQLITEEPNYYATYYHYGQLLERQGDLSQAQAIYEKGIEICTALNEPFALKELKSVLEELLF